MKKYLILTLPFQQETQQFDQADLLSLCERSDVSILDSAFIKENGIICWSLLVEYNQNHNIVKERAILKNSEIYNTLRNWRNDKSKEEGVPPYVVLSNSLLELIINKDPGSLSDLNEIKGFGEKKKKKYGSELIKIFETHHERVTERKGDFNE